MLIIGQNCVNVDWILMKLVLRYALITPLNFSLIGVHICFMVDLQYVQKEEIELSTSRRKNEENTRNFVHLCLRNS